MVVKPIHKELRPAFEGDRLKVVEALKVKQFLLTYGFVVVASMVSW